MRVISSSSLEELRNIALVEKSFALQPFEELVSRYSLTLAETEIDVQPDFSLILPLNDSWSGNMDRENSLLIQSVLPGLTRAAATDERIWVTLAFREAFEYSVIRWGGGKNNNKQILNHWFAPSSRSKWRDHSVSRLWYVSSFASNLEGISLNDALSVLYSNSELLNSFLGRPRTTASNRVASKIILLLLDKGHGSPENRFDRDKFRALMKEIDLRTGSMQINALSKMEFEDFFNGLYESIYSRD